MVGWEALRTRRILLTGAQGMLGQAFVEALTEAAHVPSQLRACSRADLDVTNASSVLAHADWRPEVIIHCAANVDADACERDPDSCRKTQVGGSENIAILARRTGARVLYPQSFLVFDGEVEPIVEDTPPHPLSTYGRCKLEAEYVISDGAPDALCIRMGGFFGGEDRDKNFVGKFIPGLIKRVREGERVIEVGDRVWQPTYTLDLARNSLLLLAQDRSGIYNMASHGVASFADVATKVVEHLGLDQFVRIETVDSARFAARESAPRPKRARLENRRLLKEGIDLQRPWSDGLADYLSRPYFHGITEGLRRTR